MDGLKTFVEEWNGHNTFVHPHIHSRLMTSIKSFFFVSVTNYHSTYSSEMGKRLGYHPVSKSQFRQKNLCAVTHRYVVQVAAFDYI